MQKKPMIVFFGIDGSGKSTLLEETKKNFEKKGEKVKVIYMGLGSEHNMPFLKQIMKITSYFRYGKNKYKKQKENNAKFREQNFRQRSFIWVLGQYSELWLRYRKAKKLSKHNIILFDRYFYDGLILGSKNTFNFFKNFTPKPHKSFLISAPPKIIWKRKKEAEPKQIEKYYKNAQRLTKKFNIIKINNTKSISKVSNEIWEKINEKN